MFANLTGWHFLIIALVVLLIFGAARLPSLARSVGQSAKILKSEMKDVATTPAARNLDNESVSGATPAEPDTSSTPR